MSAGNPMPGQPLSARRTDRNPNDVLWDVRYLDGGQFRPYSPGLVGLPYENACQIVADLKAHPLTRGWARSRIFLTESRQDHLTLAAARKAMSEIAVRSGFADLVPVVSKVRPADVALAATVLLQREKKQIRQQCLADLNGRRADQGKPPVRVREKCQAEPEIVNEHGMVVIHLGRAR